jgi:hypothetical protein
MKRITVEILAISFGASYLVAPFLFGFVIAVVGEGVLGNTVGRVFVGLVIAFFSICTLGFPPKDAGTTATFVMWPYIFACWAVMFFAGLALANRRRRVPADARAVPETPSAPPADGGNGP